MITIKVFNGIIFHSQNRQLFEYSETWWRLVLPAVLHKRIIEFTHQKLGHPGVSKTLAYIKIHFYWNSMNTDVKKYVLRCDLCQRVKHLNYSMEGEYHRVSASQPSVLVTVDFYGALPRSIGGVEYIFVVMDAHSKYVKLYPIKRATTRIALKKIFDHYILEMRRPASILSDNGTQFTSHAWKSRLQSENIQAIFSLIHHPQSNLTERIMRELGRLFKTLCSDAHTKWAQYISHIESLLNVTTHTSMGHMNCILEAGRPRGLMS